MDGEIEIYYIRQKLHIFEFRIINREIVSKKQRSVPHT